MPVALFMALALGSSSAAPPPAPRDLWYVGKDIPGETFAFFDAATLSTAAGGTRSGQVLWVFEGPDVAAVGGRRQLRTYAFDCAGRRMTLRAEIDEPAAGSAADAPASEAVAAPPNTFEGGILDFACADPAARSTLTVALRLGAVDPQAEADDLYAVFHHHKSHPRHHPVRQSAPTPASPPAS